MIKVVECMQSQKARENTPALPTRQADCYIQRSIPPSSRLLTGVGERCQCPLRQALDRDLQRQRAWRENRCQGSYKSS